MNDAMTDKEFKRRRSLRNYALAGSLVALMALLFLITLVKHEVI